LDFQGEKVLLELGFYTAADIGEVIPQMVMVRGI
jgi:hypothetical protein